jgi:NAD(P)-dependent dehydrogenase (short-subunit alcohol dehydrogenase family)
MASGLAGRRALITGAGRGIGLAIAKRLTADGMAVTMLDRNPDVLETAADLGADGLVADLRDAASTTDALNAASEAGPYWLLVNNAGVFQKMSLLETPVEVWDEVQEINTRSMLLTMQALAPAMCASGGGRIVNIASMAAKKGTPGEAAYAASKAAVVALSRIASLEFGPDGVTVNSLCPGYVMTDLGNATRTEEQVEAWAAMSPLEKLCEPEDVAGVVAFLASEDGRYMTGQSLNVSGGMCTW